MTTIIDVIKREQSTGAGDIGVFLHSNNEVARVASELDSLGIDHALVGIPEAHAEALSALGRMCEFSAGLATFGEVRLSLAVFLASTQRGGIPPVAHGLVGKGNLPALISDSLRELEASLASSRDGTISDLVSKVTHSWETLRITAGRRVWRRASDHFLRLVRPFLSQPVSADAVKKVSEVLRQARIDALVDMDYSEYGSIRLMNFHQTKGREADVVIHAFTESDYFGNENEPFEDGSRLLNVAISRARRKVIVILPPNPHGLVSPFRTLGKSKVLL